MTDAVMFCMVAGVAMMLFMCIMMVFMACKLGEVCFELERVNAKLVDVRSYTNAIMNGIRSIDSSMDVIVEDDESEDEEEVEEEVTEYIVEVEDISDEDELDIHLITAEEYHFGNGYSKNELKYFPNADQVRYYFTDNTYLCMEDVPDYIGDGLVFFGMNTKEPYVVYVRNHTLNADFRIEKVVGDCDE